MIFLLLIVEEEVSPFTFFRVQQQSNVLLIYCPAIVGQYLKYLIPILSSSFCWAREGSDP